MKKLSMEKVKLAASRWFDVRCGNGCCASRRIQSDYSMNSTDLTGPKESNYSNAIGSAKAKGQRSISRSIKATAKFAFLPRDPTRFTAAHFWYSRRNIRWLISSL